MKKTHLETINTQKEVIDEVICNTCGEVINYSRTPFDKEPMIEQEISFGYGSQFDLQIHKFDICESCYIEFINSFVIPIDIKEMI